MYVLFDRPQFFQCYAALSVNKSNSNVSLVPEPANELLKLKSAKSQGADLLSAGDVLYVVKMSENRVTSYINKYTYMFGFYGLAASVIHNGLLRRPVVSGKEEI